jgi:hypothetical protein
MCSGHLNLTEQLDPGDSGPPRKQICLPLNHQTTEHLDPKGHGR